MLWRALRHVENGCYADVGARHPVIDSVGKAFYDRVWRGVHVEPVPPYAAAEHSLVDAAYKLVYFDGLNRFYVSHRHSELEPAFETPPNVFNKGQFSEGSTWCRSVSSMLRAANDERDRRLAQADQHLATVQEAANARIRDLERSVMEMQTRCAVKAHEQALYLETKVAALETLLAAKSVQLEELRRSTSWRFSAPVRIVGRPIRRIGSAIREKRITSGIQRRILALFSRAAHFVRQRPRIKRLAIGVLNLCPPLRSGIVGMLVRLSSKSDRSGMASSASPLTPSPDWRPLTFGDLPAEARRIYLDLRTAIDV